MPLEFSQAFILWHWHLVLLPEGSWIFSVGVWAARDRECRITYQNTSPTVCTVKGPSAWRPRSWLVPAIPTSLCFRDSLHFNTLSCSSSLGGRDPGNVEACVVGWQCLLHSKWRDDIEGDKEEYWRSCVFVIALPKQVPLVRRWQLSEIQEDYATDSYSNDCFYKCAGLFLVRLCISLLQ